MRSSRLGLLGAWVTASVIAAGAASCANVIGLDGLEYDREDGAGGATSSAATTATGSAATTGEGASTASGASGATTSSTGSGPASFPVTGTAAGYLSLLGFYDLHFYRFDENSSGAPAIDSTWDTTDHEGFYIADDQGEIELGLPGVFPNNDAASFAQGGYMVVLDDAHPFAFTDDDGAFTVSFFTKLDATPDGGLPVVRCWDDDLEVGWKVTLTSNIVFERSGVDDDGEPAQDRPSPIPFPIDGEYHLVTLQKLSRGNDQQIPPQPIRGFIDGVKAFEEASDVAEVPPHACDLEVASYYVSDAVPLIIDELVIAPYGLNDDQLDAQVRCLQGGSCDPPPPE